MSQMLNKMNSASSGGTRFGKMGINYKVWAAVFAAPVVVLLSEEVMELMGAGSGTVILTGLVFGLVTASIVSVWFSRSLSTDAEKALYDARLRAALSTCQTNVMIADADYNVVYGNKTMLDMLKDAEPALQKDLPQFSAKGIVGSNIDLFHKSPSHQRNMLDGLRGTHETQLEIGGLTFDLVVNPILDDSGARIGTVVEWENVTEKLAKERAEAQSAAENTRIKVALDNCQTNVMVADTDYNVVYGNETLMEMLKEAEGDIRKDLPQFNAAKVVGTNIDVFHKNPSHQRNMLDRLTSMHEAQLELGGLTFDLLVSPIVNDAGERIGTVVEWENVTEKLARERTEAQTAAENMRIKVALDNCQTNVMVADTDYNIVYGNGTLMEMLKEAEPKIREDLPRFDAEKIIGTNIDTFHKNPAHQRNMLDHLTTTHEAQLELGGLTFDLMVSPIVNNSGERIGTVVEWDNATERLAREREEKRVAGENTRIKVALDNVATNVMVADANYDVVYMNDTLSKMLIENETDLRKELPQFDARNVIGGSIDRFHKNPSHQRGILNNLTTTIETALAIGDLRFDLVVSPVLDGDGARIGTVVEWSDVTAERAIEREIDTMVQAAVAGEFENRIPLDDKEGFMRNLSEGMNTMCQTVSDAMEDIAQALSALAGGDLTQRIDKEYKGLFDKLKTDSNQTSEQLSEIISELLVAATEVANASDEITTGTTDLSQRTEEQASNLQETAASMEQMASTVKQNAENAQQANQLSISAREVADNGGNVVNEAVEAMSRIEESSQKISDIIGVIDEIAFQTNLLALNAAVEAARAGDAGKGFAVVATEVRTLAQRSSQAAKDIKALIVDSGAQVKDGVELVNNAGGSLGEILDSIKRLSDIVSEIAAASNEQANGIEEINRAISQMDEMTQQNSALVEENSASARTLLEQSQNMRERMGFFTVDKAQAATAKQGAKAAAVVHAAPRAAIVTAPVEAVVAASGGKGSNGSSHAGHDADDWGEF